MLLSDNQGQYNINIFQRKNNMIELNTNDAILIQKKLLTQIVDEVTKHLYKPSQQLKEMHNLSQQRNFSFYALCSGEHGFIPN